jgi:GNAT superfamily N-acetyltransferase
MPDLSIRPVRVTDLRLLGAVFGPFPELIYRERLALPGAVLMAELHRRPVGALFVSTGRPDEAEIVRHLGTVPMLHRLRVVANRRRTGIGSRLVAAAEKGLRDRGHRRVAVGVDPANGVARSFYRRLGYREWTHGPLKTWREVPGGDGKVAVLPDECLVFVKELALARRAAS